MGNLSAETKIKLPTGFLLGAASSAHQVEGDNTNSDWWAFEQKGKLPESGKAADHYNRFEEDFTIAQQIGLNAMRISIEWSRIEPEQGIWNANAIEHYRKVLTKLKELGMTRMVTLHHLTLPLWLSKQGGFETKEGVEAFARFAWFVAQNLGQEIDFWITINEPEIYADMGYRMGLWAPLKKRSILMLKVLHNLIKAHKAAFRSIKRVIPKAQVGIAKNSSYFEAFRPKFLDKTATKIARYFNNHYFLSKIKNELDWIGINYYWFNRMKFDWKKIMVEMNKNFQMKDQTDEFPRSEMGWRTFPEGLKHVLVDLKKYKKPIFITENGIANARDDMRQDFIRQHLESITAAISLGVDVKGYFYWSLTDTYEWHDGFGPKFGLVEINFETLERKIRPSADVFKELRS